MKKNDQHLSRRAFLKASAAIGGGFALTLSMPIKAATEPNWAKELLPLVTITPEGRVIIQATMSEMGQGVHTSLPQIVADELDADWDTVEIKSAPADNKKFGFQGSFGSLSVYFAWDSHRKAGATAREMLKTAAAERWGVNKETCITRTGSVIHESSGKRLTYGELADAATRVAVPENAPLKNPSDFHIIGKSKPRLDLHDKITGKADFGVDVQIPGLLTAAVLKSPALGGKLVTFNAEKALAQKGVHHVVQISSGVAVVADHFWLAQKGVELIEADWDMSASESLSSGGLFETLRENVKTASDITKEEPRQNQGSIMEGEKHKAQYEFPLLAHSTMEPVNFTAHVTKGKCEFWGPTQHRNGVKKFASEHLGIPEDAVEVHTTFLGGGFGRKMDMDFVQDALEVSEQLNKPVKVMWSRENDMQHCIFRPSAVHTVTAEVNTEGDIANWHHKVASHGPKRIKWLSTDGIEHIPYAVDGFKSAYNLMDTVIPVGTFRGIAHSCTNFANEVFMDELAEKAGIDPLEFRLSKLDHDARARHALELVAEKAGWHTRKERGIYQGIALFDKPAQKSNFYIAQIVEVSKDTNGQLSIDRVVCAADFGQPINPDGIITQVEGGSAFALSMALNEEITIENGVVQQSNFDAYQLMRMGEMPKVETYVIHNTEYPRGCGEHINPATLPALANAVSSALGQRIRKLPLQLPA